MKLKIDKTTEALNSNGEVWVSNESFESDVRSMMDYYLRNKDTESGPLLELAIEDDFYSFACAYLSALIYPNGGSICIEEVTDDKVKLRKL